MAGDRHPPWRAAASAAVGLTLVIATCAIWSHDDTTRRDSTLLSSGLQFYSNSGSTQLPGGGTVSFELPKPAPQPGAQRVFPTAGGVGDVGAAPVIEMGFVPPQGAAARASTLPVVEQGFYPGEPLSAPGTEQAWMRSQAQLQAQLQAQARLQVQAPGAKARGAKARRAKAQ